MNLRVTVDQLTSFVRYGNHVNVTARSLSTCMTGTPMPLQQLVSMAPAAVTAR